MSLDKPRYVLVPYDLCERILAELDEGRSAQDEGKALRSLMESPGQFLLDVNDETEDPNAD